MLLPAELGSRPPVARSRRWRLVLDPPLDVSSGSGAVVSIIGTGPIYVFGTEGTSTALALRTMLGLGGSDATLRPSVPLRSGKPSMSSSDSLVSLSSGAETRNDGSDVTDALAL